MQTALEEESWDLILCDYSMPQFTALDALRLVQELKLDIPFIIISGNVGEDVAVQAMKAGAHDYLMKGQLSRLGEAIERELAQAEIRAERTRGLAQVKHLNHVLRAVRGINRLIVQEKNPEALLQRSAELLVETRGYQNAAFIRTDRGGTALPFVAVLENGERENVFFEPMPLSGLPTCLRAAAEAKNPVVVEEDKPECASCQFRELHSGKDSTGGTAGARRQDVWCRGHLTTEGPGNPGGRTGAVRGDGRRRRLRLAWHRAGGAGTQSPRTLPASLREHGARSRVPGREGANHPLQQGR